jgi:hypothetical protein
MSRAKVLPNRLLRKRQENRPPGFVPSKVLSELSLENLRASQCGYSGQTNVDDLTGESVESFVVIRRPERLDSR